MPIGRFSKSCRLSIKSLRNYDELGLLRPAHIDSDTGYRYYGAAQATTAVIIAMLRGLDVPLGVIRQLLDGSPEDVSRLLSEERNRLALELEKKRLALQVIERLSRADDLLPYQIRTREEPERTMLQMSARTNAEQLVPDSMALAQRLFTAMRSAGYPIGDPVIGRAQFGETQDFDVDMMVPFVDAAEQIAGSTIESIAGGLVAYTTHLGAYEELGLAHHALFAWVQAHGHEMRGDVLEIYINDPATQSPSELITEVMMPIV